ncbi:MAG: hypothetical protein JWO77_308 [Ilumatobacteraceae bacterium]|nr:hypothetical protein [Ilumatobacteraceae bacterium]
MNDLDANLAPTRFALHSLAEHVLSAAYHQATGHIGLRPSRGGFSTPRFPSEHGERTVAVDILSIVVSDDRGEQRELIRTVGDAAALAGIEPGGPAEVYQLVTPLRPDEPLALDAAASEVIGAWFAMGQAELGALRAELADHDPSEIQLWPEHLDLAFSAGEANWGVSPGDGSSEEPYLYVGPWAPLEPDGGYWNAPFGAQRTASQLTRPDDVRAFFEEGRRRLGL